MKCDELKARTAQSIAQEEEMLELGAPDGIELELVYLKSEVDKVISELKANLKESEEARYEAGADAADYYQENRKLKRTLWLTRAEICHWFDVDRYLRNHRNSWAWYNENCLTWADACVAMDVKMCKAESKCRVKAEEYE